MTTLARSQRSRALLHAMACALVVVNYAQSELPNPPWILGHRGSAGSLPEHTLEGYQLGIAQGAHFVECDVVLTKDCQPICRHEPDLSMTTDAIHKYPHLVRNATIDGIEFPDGVFTTDLTLDQIKTLRARERLPARTANSEYDFFYTVPTLQEYLDVILTADRVVGAIPETKHPTWFSQQGLTCLEGTNISAILLEALRANGFEAEFNTSEWRQRPAVIQSFEVTNLQWLSEVTPIPLDQLLDEDTVALPDGTYSGYGSLMTDEGLSSVATYATLLGPWKETFAPSDGSAPPMVAANLSRRAHDQGLLMAPYTFRNDDPWNETEQEAGAPEREFVYFFEVQQVDAVFSDFPETARFVLDNLATLGSDAVQPIAAASA